MRTAKILFTLGRLCFGGMEEVAMQLLSHLDRSRFTPFLVTLRGADPEVAKAVPTDVIVVDLGKRHGRDFKVSAALAQVCRDYRIDLIQSHNWETWLYSYLASYVANVPLVHAEHGRDSESLDEPRRRYWMKRYLAWRTNSLVTVSPEIAGVLRNHLRVPERKITVIPNGIDMLRFRPPESKQAAKVAVGCRGDRFVVGTVCASFRPVKDLATLLAAVQIIAGHNREIEVVIVGGTPRMRTGERSEHEYEAMVQRLREELALQAHVRFTGPVNDVERYLAAFDVYVNSSLYEGMSLAILSALACQVPVVATKVGGTPLFLRDGKNGILVPPESPAEIAAAVMRLMDSADLRRTLGEEGREAVEASYDQRSMVSAYERLYFENLPRPLEGPV